MISEFQLIKPVLCFYFNLYLSAEMKLEITEIEDFLREALIMREFDHPNVLSMFGVSVLRTFLIHQRLASFFNPIKNNNLCLKPDYFTVTTVAVADLGAPGTHPGRKFLLFHTVFGKNWSNNMLIPSCVGAPLANPGSTTVQFITSFLGGAW